VVGDITERAGEKPEIARMPDGSLQVDGAARIEEVGEALGVVLEHEEVASISGLVLAILGRPPEVGDEVVYDHVHFHVLAVRGHGVATSRVFPEAATADESE
jgi:CBS domain containing-hemolysin-like protein